MGQKAEKFASLRQTKFLRKIGYTDAIAWLKEQFGNKWWETMNRQTKDKRVMERDWAEFRNLYATA